MQNTNFVGIKSVRHLLELNYKISLFWGHLENLLKNKKNRVNPFSNPTAYISWREGFGQKSQSACLHLNKWNKWKTNKRLHRIVGIKEADKSFAEKLRNVFPSGKEQLLAPFKIYLNKPFNVVLGRSIATERNLHIDGKKIFIDYIIQKPEWM